MHTPVLHPPEHIQTEGIPSLSHHSSKLSFPLVNHPAVRYFPSSRPSVFFWEKIIIFHLLPNQQPKPIHASPAHCGLQTSNTTPWRIPSGTLSAPKPLEDQTCVHVIYLSYVSPYVLSSISDEDGDYLFELIGGLTSPPHSLGLCHAPHLYLHLFIGYQILYLYLFIGYQILQLASELLLSPKEITRISKAQSYYVWFCC